jgi:hypothetical protein
VDQTSPKLVSDLAEDGTAIEFIELYPPTNIVPECPKFFFGTFPAELAAQFFRYSHLWAAGVYKLRGFELVGAYGLGRDGELFCCPHANIHPAHLEGLSAKPRHPRASPPPLHATGQVALITGPGYTVYGHWLSDFLPKLYLLHASGHDIRRLRYLLPADTPAFGRAWMELAGIPAANILQFDPAGETILVEELLLPTTLHNGIRASALLRDAAQFLVSCVEEQVGTSIGHRADRRIFVSRARAPAGRTLRNRSRIEDLAVAAGLELVHPQFLALPDQVRLFRSANRIVGEYGSALHNSLFSLPGTVVCALRGSALHPGFIQSGFGHVLEQPTGYVLGETDETSADGEYTVSEPAVGECLDMLLSGAAFSDPR